MDYGFGKTWLEKRLVQDIDNCAKYNSETIITSSNFSIMVES